MHRIGSFNFASARYKKFEWECFIPNKWRKQDDKNKQGSFEEFTEAENDKFTAMNKLFFEDAEQRYNSNLYFDITREQSRIVMPMAQYTEFFWTVNFRSLANFITLRSDSHAQKEIQDYSNALLKILDDIPEIKWTMEIFFDILKLKKLLNKLVENIGMDEAINVLERFNNS